LLGNINLATQDSCQAATQPQLSIGVLAPLYVQKSVT